MPPKRRIVPVMLDDEDNWVVPAPLNREEEPVVPAPLDREEEPVVPAPPEEEENLREPVYDEREIDEAERAMNRALGIEDDLPGTPARPLNSSRDEVHPL